MSQSRWPQFVDIRGQFASSTEKPKNDDPYDYDRVANGEVWFNVLSHDPTRLYGPTPTTTVPCGGNKKGGS